MSFFPLFYINSVICMCVVCFLSLVDFNKMFYKKKHKKTVISFFAILVNIAKTVIIIIRGKFKTKLSIMLVITKKNDTMYNNNIVYLNILCAIT